MNFLIFIKFFIDRQVKVRYERNDQIELISAPLIFSINLNHTGFVRTLLDHQISLNERDENGNDPWKVIQIENINIEIVKLIENYIIRKLYCIKINKTKRSFQ